MAKLPFRMFSKEPMEDGNVFIFGKSPELYSSDFADGIARIGGPGRHPNYFFTYLLAARKMVDDGKESGTYDDIGLPVFYLQRHATELLIKRLLSWCYDLVELQSKEVDFKFMLSNNAVGRVRGSHDLNKLFADLTGVTAALGYELPVEIGALVQAISEHEITETFARYERSGKGDEVVLHVASEVSLPIVALQLLLESTAKVSLFQRHEDESLELTLHDAWQAKTFHDLSE